MQARIGAVEKSKGVRPPTDTAMRHHWSVVTEDGGRRPGFDEAPKDVARMNLDAGKAAQPATLVEEHAMPHIERDGPELLSRQACEACAHVKPNVRGTGQTPADPRSLANRRPRQLERGATSRARFRGSRTVSP